MGKGQVKELAEAMGKQDQQVSKRHPLKGGRHETKGVNPVKYKGTISYYYATYTDIEGVQHLENFSVKKYGEEEAYRRAKLMRLKGMLQYHQDCINEILKEAKNMKGKEGSG